MTYFIIAWDKPEGGSVIRYATATSYTNGWRKAKTFDTKWEAKAFAEARGIKDFWIERIVREVV